MNTSPTNYQPFLQVKNLKIHFPIIEGLFFQKQVAQVYAVDGVSFPLKKGEILGLVGESGCGKSTLGRGILRLLPLTDGELFFEGMPMHQLSLKKLRPYRKHFQMIFQDPYASLDPRMSIFDTLAEPLLFHKMAHRKNLNQKIVTLMKEVGLKPSSMRKYPHEFSGGQRQRIAIARALAVQPKLVIADEPVSALDVSIQAQIINLLWQLSQKRKFTMIFISHDLSVVKHLSHKVAVMYLGKIVEWGLTSEVFQNPKHPYTRALLSAVPIPNPTLEKKRSRLLLEGDPPSPIHPPQGCRFHPRCPYQIPECKLKEPLLDQQKTHIHVAACIRQEQLPRWSV